MSTTELKLLTPLECAELARVSRSLIYQWIEEKRLKCMRAGGRGRRGRILVRHEELMRFLDTLEQDD